MVGDEDESHISRDDFDRILTEIIAGERWIIEGDYSRTYEARLQARVVIQICKGCYMGFGSMVGAF